MPGISQLSRDEWQDTWYWRFTALSARRLLEEVFPATGIAVATHGNVLATVAFLQGIAAEELRPEELAAQDPQFDLVCVMRAVKA